MMALGQRITEQDAVAMIGQVDANGDGKLDMQEFGTLMLGKMKEELLSSEDNVEDLKAKFLDADVDCSGSLTVDEIYSVLLKMGAELTLDELVELMYEIDVDRNGSLDIDEFIALMTVTGGEVQFQSANANRTLQNIRKTRRLNPLDFFKCFKSMPSSFVPSFFAERWSMRKNLPSSVFMPMIDPRTMLYKDISPVLQENIPPNMIN
jgi:calmodulin